MIENDTKIVNFTGDLAGATIGTIFSIETNNPLASVFISPIIAYLWKHFFNNNNFSETQRINIAKTVANIEPNNSDVNIPNEEWLSEYFNCIKDKEDESIQSLWRKILSQEINNNGSYSVRTLSVIKNISINEARTFEKILPYTLLGKDFYYLSNCKTLINYGITLYDLMILDECGLLVNNQLYALKSIVKPNETQKISNNKKVLFLRNISKYEMKMEFKAYPLTMAGNELIKILDNSYDENFIVDLAKELEKDYKDIEIIVFDKKASNDNLNNLVFESETVIK